VWEKDSPPRTITENFLPPLRLSRVETPSRHRLLFALFFTANHSPITLIHQANRGKEGEKVVKNVIVRPCGWHEKTASWYGAQIFAIENYTDFSVSSQRFN
jgi:hypothetical protein